MKSILHMPKFKADRNPAIAQISDVQDRIRSRAFELYEERGREDGHELDDWLQAEAEAASEIAA